MAASRFFIGCVWQEPEEAFNHNREGGKCMGTFPDSARRYQGVAVAGKRFAIREFHIVMLRTEVEMSHCRG